MSAEPAPVSEEHEEKGGEEVSEKDLEAEPQVHFEPLVKLQEVKVQTHEEDEDVLFKMYWNIDYLLHFFFFFSSNI